MEERFRPLIARACQGDQRAFAEIVEAHREPVFRLAYLLLGDPDDAEDVAQETFLRAYHALDRFDVSRPLRPWLLQIAANQARNRRRSLGRYLGALKRFAQYKEPDGPDTEAISDGRLQSQMLWQAIRRLSRADQEILYLRHFLELPVDETAASLNISQGTVKSRLHRAHQRLRAVIERDYPELDARPS